MRRILGIDPGLRVTGFGVIAVAGQRRLVYVDERLHPRERRRACRRGSASSRATSRM